MQPLVQGVYNSVMFALIILIAHFMIKNDASGQHRGREYLTPEEPPLSPPPPVPATMSLEMQGGDVDSSPTVDADAEAHRRRRADEQKSMLFAYVQGGGGGGGDRPESVLNGGSLGLGDISGYSATSGYGSFSLAS